MRERKWFSCEIAQRENKWLLRPHSDPNRCFQSFSLKAFKGCVLPEFKHILWEVKFSLSFFRTHAWASVCILSPVSTNVLLVCGLLLVSRLWCHTANDESTHFPFSLFLLFLLVAPIFYWPGHFRNWSCTLAMLKDQTGFQKSTNVFSRDEKSWHECWILIGGEF